MHFPSPADAEGIRGIGFLHAEGDVLQHFPKQPVPQMAGGDELSLLSGERAVVDRKGHLHRRLGDLHEGDGLRHGGIADGIPDGEPVQPRKTDDVARGSAVDGAALQPLDLIERDQFSALHAALRVVIGDRHVLIDARGSPFDPPDADAPDVFVVVDGGNQNLQGARGIHFLRFKMLHDRVEQGL